MDISTKQWVLGFIGLAALVTASLGAERYVAKAPTPESSGAVLNIPQATSSQTLPAQSPVAGPSAASANTPTALSINSADKISSLEFKGAYAGSETLTANAKADIVHLTGLLGKGQYDDYDLYIGIANDNDLLGNGTLAYANYNRAVAIHPRKGLAYANLANLFTELGAFNTAADAYAKAVAAEPTVEQFWLSYLNFLTLHEASSSATPAIFATAKKATNSAPDVLIAEANWLADIGRYADAIADWKAVRPSTGKEQKAAIDKKIAELQSKQ